MKKLIIFIIFLLSFESFSGNAAPANRFSGEQGFLINKGQILNSDNSANKDILFYSHLPSYSVYIFPDKISFVYYKSTDTGKSRIGDTILCYREDHVFRSFSLNQNFSGVKQNHYCNYYKEYCPSGITDIESYSSIIFRTNDFTLDFSLQNGRLIYKLTNLNNSIARIDTLNDRKNQHSYVLKAIEWASYLGGSGNEAARVVKCDLDNNIIVTGYTRSFNFPVTTGVSRVFGGDEDMYFAKFKNDGTLIYSIYLGGSGKESSLFAGISPDGTYWFGSESWSGDFPVTSDAFDNVNHGGGDGAVVKISNDGKLLYATFIGGGGYDAFGDGACDGFGNVWVTGRTVSDYPVSAGAFQSQKRGFYDAVLTKFSKDGVFLYSTYLGGSGDEFAEGIAIDKNNFLNISGYSTSDDFPSSSNAYKKTITGQFDAFICRFDNNGKMLWSTLFGGSDNDHGSNLACDRNGNLILHGYTNSRDLPTSGNVCQANFAGGNDAFIAKFTSNGSFLWTTYFGGSIVEGFAGGIMDQDGGVEADSKGNIAISGLTQSTDLKVTPDAYQSTVKFQDALLLIVDSNGKKIWASYLGGTGAERGFDVTFDKSDNLIAVGTTNSSDFPVTAGAFQTKLGGDYDGYIVKFGQKTSGDTSAPRFTTTDSCNTVLYIQIADTLLSDTGIDYIQIAVSDNCTIRILNQKASSALIEVRISNPALSASYKIIITDKFGNITIIQNTFRASQNNITGFPAPNFSDNKLNFGKRIIASISVDSLKIHNNTDVELKIDNIKLLQNIYFSIPQSQLPIIVPPHDSAAFYIVFHPVAASKTPLRDTIIFDADYCNSFIELIGYGEETLYYSNSDCDIKIKYNGFLVPDDYVDFVYPNPITETLNIVLQGKDGLSAKIDIYDVRGNKIKCLEGIKLFGGEKSININVSDFPQGIYYLQINTGLTNHFNKFIKN